MKKIMEIKKAIKVLELHQRWRKGEPLKMQEPKLISASIDAVLTIYNFK